MNIQIDQLNLSNNINLEKYSVKIDENQTFYLCYYYNNIDRNKNELFFRLINRSGSFGIRKHQKNFSSLIESPYVLSLMGSSLKIFHYFIYRINQHLFLKPFSNQFSNLVKHFLDEYQQNVGVLPCTRIEYLIHFTLNTYNSSSSLSLLTIQTNKLRRQQIIGRSHFDIV